MCACLLLINPAPACSSSSGLGWRGEAIPHGQELHHVSDLLFEPVQILYAQCFTTPVVKTLKWWKHHFSDVWFQPTAIPGPRTTQVINHGLGSPHSHCCLSGHQSSSTSHSAGFEVTCHPAILSPYCHCAAFKGTPRMQCLQLRWKKVGTVFDSILFLLSWFWAPLPTPPLVVYNGSRGENPPWLQV